jgi:hypothetical protein
MTASACRRGRKGIGSGLLLARTALFDLDHLPATIVAAAWANVVGTLHLAARSAGDEVNRSDEDVPPAIALAMPADALLGKCSHD